MLRTLAALAVAVGSLITPARAGVESLSLSPAPPIAGQPFTAVAAGTLSDTAYSLSKGGPTLAASTLTLHLVIYRDPFAAGGLIEVPFSAVFDLPALPAGDYTMDLYEHALLATDPAEVTALLAAPLAYTGPASDPFSSYSVRLRSLAFTVNESSLVPEPASIAWLCVGAVSVCRARRRVRPACRRARR